MFCEGCGNQIENGSMFCESCGWKVPEGAWNEPELSSAPAPDMNQMQEPSYAPAQDMNQMQEASYAPAQDMNQMQEPSYAPAQDMNQMPQQYYGGAYDPNAQMYASFEQQAPIPVIKQKKKFSFKSPKFIVPAAIVCVLLVCGIIFRDYVANFCIKTFASDETYYQYVEKKEALEFAEAFSEGYGIYTTTLAGENDNTVKGSLTVTLGDDTIEMLEAYTQDMETLGLDDLSWCSTVSIDYTMVREDNKYSYECVFSLGSSKLITMNMIMDLEENKIYLQFPELSEDYICVDNSLEAGYGYSSNSVASLYSEMAANLPSQKEMEKLLGRYIKCVIESVNDVDKDSSTITAGNVSAKYTELSYDLDLKLVSNIMNNVYKTAKNDKDLKKVVGGLLDLSGMGAYYDKDEFYDEMMDEFKDACSEMKEMAKEYNSSAGTMTVWVNAKGDIVGRDIKVGGGYSQVELGYYAPEKGSKCGFDMFVNAYGETVFEIDGSGKKSGDKVTGTYSLIVQDMELVDFDLSKVAVEMSKDGSATGSITISTGKDYEDFIEEEFGYSYYDSERYMILSALSEYSLKIDMNSKNKKANATYTILNGKDVLVSISASTSASKGGTAVKVPSKADVYDAEYESEEFIKTFDIEGYIQKLDKSVFPKEIREILEELAEADVDEWEDILDEKMEEIYGY